MSDNKIQSGLSSLKKWAGLDETPKADAPLKPAVDTCAPQPKPAAEPVRDSFSASDVMDGARDFLKKVGNTASEAVSRDLPITGMPTQTIAQLAAGATEGVGEIAGKLKDVSPSDVRDAAMQARELILSSKDQLKALTSPMADKITDRLTQLPDQINNARVGLEQELAVQKASVEVLGEVISVGVSNYLDHQMGELGIPRDEREAMTLLNETVNTVAQNAVQQLSESELVQVAGQMFDDLGTSFSYVADKADRIVNSEGLADKVVAGLEIAKDATWLASQVVEQLNQHLPNGELTVSPPIPVLSAFVNISVFDALVATEGLIGKAIEYAPAVVESFAPLDPVVLDKRMQALTEGSSFAFTTKVGIDIHKGVGGGAGYETETKVKRPDGTTGVYELELNLKMLAKIGIGVGAQTKGLSADLQTNQGGGVTIRVSDEAGRKALARFIAEGVTDPRAVAALINHGELREFKGQLGPSLVAQADIVVAGVQAQNALLAGGAVKFEDGGATFVALSMQASADVSAYVGVDARLNLNDAAPLKDKVLSDLKDSSLYQQLSGVSPEFAAQMLGLAEDAGLPAVSAKASVGFNLKIEGELKIPVNETAASQGTSLKLTYSPSIRAEVPLAGQVAVDGKVEGKMEVEIKNIGKLAERLGQEPQALAQKLVNGEVTLDNLRAELKKVGTPLDEHITLSYEWKSMRNEGTKLGAKGFERANMTEHVSLISKGSGSPREVKAHIKENMIEVAGKMQQALITLTPPQEALKPLTIGDLLTHQPICMN